eukprot:1340831-Amorphochlora_amoeboformis.AAC.1
MNGMPGVGVSLSIGDMQSSHLSSPRDVGAPFSPLSDNSESQNGGQVEPFTSLRYFKYVYSPLNWG